MCYVSFVSSPFELYIASTHFACHSVSVRSWVSSLLSSFHAGVVLLHGEYPTQPRDRYEGGKAYQPPSRSTLSACPNIFPLVWIPSPFLHCDLFAAFTFHFF